MVPYEKIDSVSRELTNMFSDRTIGLRALKIMSELNVIDNYITRNKSNDKSDAYTLALLFDKAIKPPFIGEDQTKLFQKVYFLCMFKMLENDLSALL